MTFMIVSNRCRYIKADIRASTSSHCSAQAYAGSYNAPEHPEAEKEQGKRMACGPLSWDHCGPLSWEDASELTSCPK